MPLVRPLGRFCFILFAVFAVSVPTMGASPPVAEAVKDVQPDALVRSITEEVMRLTVEATVKSTGELKDHKKLIRDVQLIVEPHFDFARMTRLALGVHWRKATVKQQEELTAEFRTLLLNTYSGIFIILRAHTPEFKPFRMTPKDTDVTVRLELKKKAQVIKFGVSMEKTSAGWKVYNIVVDGVSLVSTYRETFSAKVKESGIDGLIAELSKKNQEFLK